MTLSQRFSLRSVASAPAEAYFLIELCPDLLDVAWGEAHRRAGENAGDVAECATEVHAARIDGEFANLLLVRRPTHLENGQAALHLTEHLHIAKENDRVGERGDVRLGDRASSHQCRRRGREQPRDLLVLDERRDADDEFPECLDGPTTLQCRQAVQCDASRLELLNDGLDADQPVLETGHLGVVADYTEQSVLLHAIEVDAPSDGVAEELLPALLEGEQQTALTIRGAAAEELGHGQRLPRSGGARDEDHRIPEEPTAAHLVEVRAPRRDPYVRRLLTK